MLKRKIKRLQNARRYKKIEVLKKLFGKRKNGHYTLDLSDIDFGDWHVNMRGVHANTIYNNSQHAEDSIYNDNQRAENIYNGSQTGIAIIYNSNMFSNRIYNTQQIASDWILNNEQRSNVIDNSSQVSKNISNEKQIIILKNEE